MDWNEADEHCKKADLCIIAGTSMSLRHITHFPFMAKKVVLINLQPTPDDSKADLRIWAKCDPVFAGLMQRLDNMEVDPVPVWRPRDGVSIDKIPSWVHPYYVAAAARLELVAQQREKEASERKEAAKKKREERRLKKEERKEKNRREERKTKQRSKKKHHQKEEKEKEQVVIQTSTA